MGSVMRLADCFTPARLAEHLRPWRPYPPIADRRYWERVPGEIHSGWVSLCHDLQTLADSASVLH